jgi:hypothetical protein
MQSVVEALCQELGVCVEESECVTERD